MQSKSQTKLYLDSMLKEAYIAKYPFSEGLTCIPFYCDPFQFRNIKVADTAMCGKYVFINKNFEVKIRPIFDLPCYFEPKFSEGLCAVNIKGEIVYIDSFGTIKVNTHLPACSIQKNRATPFRKGIAKLYKGSNTPKNFMEIYSINKSGFRIEQIAMVKVKIRPILIASRDPEKDKDKRPSDAKKDLDKPGDVQVFRPVFDLPGLTVKNHYPIAETEAQRLLNKYPHKNNRMLLYYDCGEYQKENMAEEDTFYCGKFVFVDTLFNVKINSGFEMPCAFEPEFSEGLCAVAIDSQIVYIDTLGHVIIKTNLASCNKEQNKASTFKNGIATLYHGNINSPGFYTTIAINVFGERVRLLEFDELELATKRLDKFTNLTSEESIDCFVGKGKSNGLWFLIEKSGKVRKKLVLKQ
ncbi:MAG: hypothetical protein PSX81_12260 [bacterium]|nr:hypothetical protein [bacterium]